MNLKLTAGLVLGLVSILGLGILIGANLNLPAFAQGGAAGSPRYTVVETEGVHLIVTDNGNNTVYFYTIDPGEKPGADLNLRGSADLTQVGKPVIKPTLNKPKTP